MSISFIIPTRLSIFTLECMYGASETLIVRRVFPLPVFFNSIRTQVDWASHQSNNIYLRSSSEELSYLGPGSC